MNSTVPLLHEIAPDLVASRCRACGQTDLNDFYTSRSPAHIGVVHATREEALQAKRGSVRLAHCASCDLIQNRAAGRKELTFEPGFEVRLVHSPTFRAF